jgi:hypothetical protein
VWQPKRWFSADAALGHPRRPGDRLAQRLRPLDGCAYQVKFPAIVREGIARFGLRTWLCVMQMAESRETASAMSGHRAISRIDAIIS